MRHSNHSLLRRIERTIIRQIFWMPVKTCRGSRFGTVHRACHAPYNSGSRSVWTRFAPM